MAGSEQPTGMPSIPTLRASDAERERTATLLREHYAAGRLTSDELSDRLDAAFGARTVAELDVLTHDLPPSAEPVAVSPARGLARKRVLHAVGLAVLLNAACIAVWLASGAGGVFWPQWVLLASVIRLAFRAWSELGPGGAEVRSDEARLGRGGSGPRPPRLPDV